MANFPHSIPYQQGTVKTTLKPALRGEFENNYGFTRPTSSRARYKFELNYEVITKTEYDTLEQFFKDNQGVLFNFYYELDNTTYVCMFVNDEIASTPKSATITSTKLTLITV